MTSPSSEDYESIFEGYRLAGRPRFLFPAIFASNYGKDSKLFNTSRLRQFRYEFNVMS